jgi:hypothetical protein
MEWMLASLKEGWKYAPNLWKNNVKNDKVLFTIVVYGEQDTVVSYYETDIVKVIKIDKSEVVGRAT